MRDRITHDVWFSARHTRSPLVFTLALIALIAIALVLSR